jgi:hypothetical protein
MMTFKTCFLLCIAALSLNACAPAYYRPTDMHHLRSVPSIELHKRQHEVRVTRHEVRTHEIISDTTYAYTPCTDFKPGERTDTCLYLLEKGKVVYYLGSYWVKKGSKVNESGRYTNNDVKF